jgi:integrase
MSVHKTKSGKPWEVRWREGTRNRGRKFDRKGDADAFWDQVKRQAQLGSAVPTRTGSTTLSEFFARWIAARQKLAPRTRLLYERLFEVHVFDQIGYVPLSNLTPERLEDWQAERLGSGAGKEVIAKTGRLLNQLFVKAMRDGSIPRNPIEGMEKPKVETKRLPPASPQKVEELRRWFLTRERDGDAVLVSLLAYGGLRMGEAFALQWADLSQGDRLWISHSLEDDGSLKGTKNGKERLVVLPGPAAEDLLAWRREMGAAGFVFPRAKDTKGWTLTDRNNWRRRYYSPAARAVGLEGPPKDLRHAAASLRIAAGKRPTEVAEELGHTLAVSVDVYQRLMREMEGQPVRPMDEMIREARTHSEQAEAKQRLSPTSAQTEKVEDLA